MRKGLLMLFAVISLHSLAQSSIWTKGHAVWHYSFFNVGEKGYIKVWESGDTTILGKQCKEIKAKRHSFIMSGPTGSPFETISDYKGGIIYHSNDTVFYWNGDLEQFFVLFDFSAQPNDNWILDITPTEYMSCNDTSVCVVQSVGSLMIGGQNAVELNLGKTADSFRSLNGKTNSRFGTTECYLFPFDNTCEEWGALDLDQVSFLCFEDDSLYYNPSGGACEYYLGLDESVKQSVSVYPNPSSGKIELLSEVPLKQIKVMNVLGAVLKAFDTNLTLTEIDLSGLPQGTYYLDIENANGEQTVKSVQISGR